MASPTEGNNYLEQHAAVLLRCFTQFTGLSLVEPRSPVAEQARYLFFAPFVVVAHDAGSDPSLPIWSRSSKRIAKCF